MAPQAVLMLVTAGTRDEAERIGEALVEERLAACVSVIPVVHSFYRWEGRLQREHEALLLVKTLAEKSDAVMAFVRERHSYELPEILRVNVDGGLSAYLDWMQAETSAPKDTHASEPAGDS
jgi:periplasmic divalent cation tolerance protein